MWKGYNGFSITKEGNIFLNCSSVSSFLLKCGDDIPVGNGYFIEVRSAVKSLEENCYKEYTNRSVMKLIYMH